MTLKQTAMYEVYPRTHGETAPDRPPHTSRPVLGLSPYTRGNLVQDSGRVCGGWIEVYPRTHGETRFQFMCIDIADGGSIPVHTGKPFSVHHPVRNLDLRVYPRTHGETQRQMVIALPIAFRVYPRTHGETQWQLLIAADQRAGGLSPYTRGNQD